MTVHESGAGSMFSILATRGGTHSLKGVEDPPCKQVASDVAIARFPEWPLVTVVLYNRVYRVALLRRGERKTRNVVMTATAEPARACRHPATGKRFWATNEQGKYKLCRACGGKRVTVNPPNVSADEGEREPALGALDTWRPGTMCGGSALQASPFRERLHHLVVPARIASTPRQGRHTMVAPQAPRWLAMAHERRPGARSLVPVGFVLGLRQETPRAKAW